MELAGELRRGESSENITNNSCDTRPSLLCAVHTQTQALPRPQPPRPAPEKALLPWAEVSLAPPAFLPGLVSFRARSGPGTCRLRSFERLNLKQRSSTEALGAGLRPAGAPRLSLSGAASPVWVAFPGRPMTRILFTGTQQFRKTAQPHALETIPEMKAPSLGHFLVECFLICFRKAHPKQTSEKRTGRPRFLCSPRASLLRVTQSPRTWLLPVFL